LDGIVAKMMGIGSRIGRYLLTVGLRQVAILLLAVGVICGCARQPETSDSITLAVYAGDTTSLVWIAAKQGLFADNGLDVTLREYEAGKLAADALLAGDVEIATAAEFVFVSQSFDHEDLRILGSIATAEINQVIARSDRGISEPSDLRGKRIGVTRQSAGEFFLGRFLLSHDLPLEDVEIVDLTPSAIVSAISAGEIDAALTWEPNIYEIRHLLGEDSVSWPGQSDQHLYFVLIARDAWLSGHPEAAERFLRAIAQAEEYLERHVPVVQQAIAERFDYSQEYMAYIWPRHLFALTLPQALLLAMEDEARWRIENRLTDKTVVPNYLEHVHRDTLRAVRPESVTIIE
jgi:NitT/TauT family transport system substrate-binding protein